MTEAPSTRRVALNWAARSERHDELRSAPTSFFLFKEDEGRVVVRGREDGSTESQSTASGSSGVETGERTTTLKKLQRVPQTKLLRSTADQRYILLKKYEGFVTGRSKETFSARLFETVGDYPALEAEFDLEELSESDRQLAVEGASMVWTIGYAYEGSTRKRQSLIYIRRLLPWSDAEIEKARGAAKELVGGIEWE